MKQVKNAVYLGAKDFYSAAHNVLRDTAEGSYEIAHNGLAMLGLGAAVLAAILVFKPEIRQQSETALLGWLQLRHANAQPAVASHTTTSQAIVQIANEPEAIERATAADPADLPKQQAAVAYWLSKKYRVAPEPISALVEEAYDLGQSTKIEPALILAIMAIESSFNPFAQSPVGAQGLMQVMTKIHSDKYDGFGGNMAAFDPLTNLKVGVKVLQECIARAGSVEGGLRRYVGATSDATEGGYTAKVLAEYGRLKEVAAGKSIPFTTPSTAPGLAQAPNVPANPSLLTKPAPIVMPALAPAVMPIKADAEEKLPTL